MSAGTFTGRAVLAGGKSADVGLVVHRDGSATASVLVPGAGSTPQQIDLTGSVRGDGSFQLSGAGIVVSGTGAAGGTFSVQVAGATGTGQLAAAPTRPAAPFLPNYVPALSRPQHWMLRELRVFVDRGVETRDIDFLSQQVMAAAQLWAQKAPGLVTFRPVTRADDADITVRFVPTDDPAALGDRLGQTRVTFYDDSLALVDAQVSVETNLGESLLPKVLAHEIGHALGLNGHSADPDDLMFPTTSGAVNITTRDANTVARVYSGAAGRSQPTGAKSQTRQALLCGPEF